MSRATTKAHTEQHNEGTETWWVASFRRVPHTPSPSPAFNARVRTVEDNPSTRSGPPTRRRYRATCIECSCVRACAIEYSRAVTQIQLAISTASHRAYYSRSEVRREANKVRGHKRTGREAGGIARRVVCNRLFALSWLVLLCCFFPLLAHLLADILAPPLPHAPGELPSRQSNHPFSSRLRRRPCLATLVTRDLLQEGETSSYP